MARKIELIALIAALLGLGLIFGPFDTLDLPGLILAVAGGALVLWRIRVRLRGPYRWIADACPVCGAHLRRSHRRPLDRIIGFVLLPHSRRYRCTNPDCGWSGLRAGVRRHPGAEHSIEEAAVNGKKPGSWTP